MILKKKNVIKIVYYLVYKLNMNANEALKMIRYDIFYNYCFNLNYYNGNRRNILAKIIENCGGTIINNKNKNQLNNMKLLFVCTEEDYNNNKDEIKKEQFLMDNSKVISDKYILDSYFFMTNLDKELDNSKYYLDNDNEENFDDY